MLYLNLAPRHWYLIEQSPNKVAYRFKPNPFIDLEIQSNGHYTFIGYGAYTQQPELALREDALIEAADIAECYATA